MALSDIKRFFSQLERDNREFTVVGLSDNPAGVEPIRSVLYVGTDMEQTGAAFNFGRQSSFFKRIELRADKEFLCMVKTAGEKLVKG